MTATTTTPVAVPHAWLASYISFGGSYEATGNATGKNGRELWESYVAGLDPTDEKSQFTATITMDAAGNPVITWTPDLSKDATPRAYTTYGKGTLSDEKWLPVTDENKAKMKFFKVGVELK